MLCHLVDFFFVRFLLELELWSSLMYAALIRADLESRIVVWRVVTKNTFCVWTRGQACRKQLDLNDLHVSGDRTLL